MRYGILQKDHVDKLTGRVKVLTLFAETGMEELFITELFQSLEGDKSFEFKIIRDGKIFTLTFRRD